MTSCRYGRMRKDGHCMTSADYINIGCFADALAHFDAWCSGRRSCKVKVNRLMEELRPCNRDLRSYVEAKYACVKGTHMNTSQVKVKVAIAGSIRSLC